MLAYLTKQFSQIRSFSRLWVDISIFKFVDEIESLAGWLEQNTQHMFY